MEDVKIKLQKVVDKVSPLIQDYPLEDYYSWQESPFAANALFLHAIQSYARCFIEILKPEDADDALLQEMCDRFCEPEITINNSELVKYFYERMWPATAPNNSIFKKYYLDSIRWLKRNTTHHFDTADMLGCMHYRM